MCNEAIEFVEGTTRTVKLHCKNKDTGKAFDFDGYSASTYLHWSPNDGMYLISNIDGDTITFEIPAPASLNHRSGTVETRIYKDGVVISVVILDVHILKSRKPDIAPPR